MPENVKKIISTLEAAGFEAYAVGGCVRDVILGREPEDWDITTSARPEELKSLFGRTVDTGIQHGTVTVLMGGLGYEVTTYRIDGIYEDARHPSEVSYTDNLLEDLKRRDFTINAMAYNDKRGLVDAFDGIGDLNRGIIRCVGNPMERFGEDALRMMRAVRFGAQLGFSLEEETAAAAKKLAPNLCMVSAERIMAELTKLIMSDNPERLRDAYNMGLTAQFLPEFDLCMETSQNTPYHCYDVGEHILHTMMNCRPDRIMRFTMLLHDIGKPQTKTIDAKGISHNKGHGELGAKMAVEILRRLKSDNELIDSVKVLIKYHDWRFKAEKTQIRRAMSRVGYRLFPLLLEVQEADLAGKSEYRREEKSLRLVECRRLYEEILADKDAVTIKELKVSGRDLIEAGISEGPEVGAVLKQMLEHVLEAPEDNNKDILLSRFCRVQVS